jgi:hypothetical protein
MNLSHKVAPHLSHLRRFSRELTGDQTSGDTYVAVLLDSIIADPSMLDEAADVRVALFQRFCQLWESTPFAVRMKPSDERYAGISPRVREAFLLTKVEGFTLHQVSQILSCDLNAVTELLHEASEALDRKIGADVPTAGDIHANGHRRELWFPRPAQRRHAAPGTPGIAAELKQAPLAEPG